MFWKKDSIVQIKQLVDKFNDIKTTSKKIQALYTKEYSILLKAITQFAKDSHNDENFDFIIAAQDFKKKEAPTKDDWDNFYKTYKALSANIYGTPKDKLEKYHTELQKGESLITKNAADEAIEPAYKHISDLLKTEFFDKLGHELDVETLKAKYEKALEAEKPAKKKDKGIPKTQSQKDITTPSKTFPRKGSV